MFIETVTTTNRAPEERNVSGDNTRASLSSLAAYRGVAQLSVILLCAFTLKLLYSTASPNGLRWILAPTTLLVELVTGESFTFESHAGYMNGDHSFLIAASCAGVNFLITSFLMLSLSRLWRARSKPQSHSLPWRFIPLALLFAYLATLIANTVRIGVALRLRQTPLEISWLSGNQLHRFEGILIYFGFLLLLYFVSEKTSEIFSRSDGRQISARLCYLRVLCGSVVDLSGRRFATETRSLSTPLCYLRALCVSVEDLFTRITTETRSSLRLHGGKTVSNETIETSLGKTRKSRKASGLLKQSLFPLLIYYGTTLGMPLANGAYRQGTGFWEHALFVLLIPLVLILPLAIFRIARPHKVSGEP